MFIVVSCEHYEHTEEPKLCGKFSTKEEAEEFIKKAVKESLEEFKDEELVEDNIVVSYDESGNVDYGCVWTILEV